MLYPVPTLLILGCLSSWSIHVCIKGYFGTDVAPAALHHLGHITGPIIHGHDREHGASPALSSHAAVESWHYPADEGAHYPLGMQCLGSCRVVLKGGKSGLSMHLDSEGQAARPLQMHRLRS